MEEVTHEKASMFWVGLVGAVYTSVIFAGASAGVEMPWRIGVGLSAVLVYCKGNNPGLTGKY